MAGFPLHNALGDAPSPGVALQHMEAAMIQLSLDVPDQPGILAKVVEIMAREKIDIKALALSRNIPATDRGVIKMIVNDSNVAGKALERQGFAVTYERVIVTAIDDHPGGLFAILTILGDAGVNIAFAYSFVSRVEGKALSVFVFDDPDAAAAALKAADVVLVDAPQGGEAGAPIPDESELAAHLGGVFYW